MMSCKIAKSKLYNTCTEAFNTQLNGYAKLGYTDVLTNSMYDNLGELIRSTYVYII